MNFKKIFNLIFLFLFFQNLSLFPMNLESKISNIKAIVRQLISQIEEKEKEYKVNCNGQELSVKLTRVQYVFGSSPNQVVPMPGYELKNLQTQLIAVIPVISGHLIIDPSNIEKIKKVLNI